MITRRRMLALGASGVATLGGCFSGGQDEATPTAAGTPTTTPGSGTDTDEPTTETLDSETDETSVTGDLPEWKPAWTLGTAYSQVLGIDVGPEHLLLSLSGNEGPSAVAALRRGEQSFAWEQSFEGEAEGENPDSPEDHRDQWGVAVAGGTVYSVHGRADTNEWTALHALEAASGEERWSVRRERDLAVQGVRDGTAFATGVEFFEPEHTHDTPEEPLQTELYGLDVASGDEQWTASFDGVRDVALGQSDAVVATSDGLTAVGPDGAERWHQRFDRAFQALATVGDVTIVAVGDGGDSTTVRGIGADGKVTWTRSRSAESLFAHGDRVYAFGSPIAALESDGTVAWTGAKYGGDPTFSPSGDRLYTRAGIQADAVDAYDLPSGRHEFRFDTPSNNGWPVAATDDAVIAEAITPDEAEFTSLFAVSAETGEPQAVYRPEESVFDTQVAAGMVYTGFGDGSLAAFETGDW